VELSWLDAGKLDNRDVDGAVAVLEAARVVDHPHTMWPTTRWFEARLHHGWDGDPPVAAVTRDARGRVVGVLQVWSSTWDNTHLGGVDVTVDPAVRRQGIGRELFAAGVERIRAEGRTLLVADCFDGTAGVPFLKAMGLDPALESIHRRQHLIGLDSDRLDGEFGTALGHAGGYELVRIPGAVPDELLDAVAEMTAAINDAPIGDLAIEDEVFTGERIRAFEVAQAGYRRRLYRVVARERETGTLAGHTMVYVDGRRPWYGAQCDTSVLRPHRGHRLGLLLKIDMVRWLAEQEPQVRFIDTDNAATNAHMIRVNELLGYEVVAKSIEWQRHL